MKIDKFKEFISETITVQGFNEPRELEIVNVYKIGKYNCFHCIRQGTKERENLLCKNAMVDGKLRIDTIRVLTA